MTPRAVRLSWLVAACVVIGAAVALLLWLQTPPAIARLLPECDGLVYANLKPIRAATHWDQRPITRAPEFQAFIDATGIMPERDLDAVAMALHRRSNPTGPNGPVSYSEVFAGHFDAERLARYLGTIAAEREQYAGQTIFTIPVGDAPGQRQLRVAVLGGGRVAADNAATPEFIHAMLDRARGNSGFPALGAVWAGALVCARVGFGQLGLPFAENGFISAGGLQLPLRADTDFVASVRYTGAIKLRVQALAGSPLDAARTAQELSALLTLARAVAATPLGGGDGSARTLLDSLALTADGDRVLLTGAMPVDLLRQLTGASAQAPR